MGGTAAVPKPGSAPHRSASSSKQLYVSPTLSPVLQTPFVRVVAIGGLDPSGGAGLVRDAATARALGAGVVLLGTAWTDQSRHGVRGFEVRDPAALRDAAKGCLAAASAVKVGMVGSPQLVAA